MYTHYGGQCKWCASRWYWTSNCLNFVINTKKYIKYSAFYFFGVMPSSLKWIQWIWGKHFLENYLKTLTLSLSLSKIIYKLSVSHTTMSKLWGHENLHPKPDLVICYRTSLFMLIFEDLLLFEYYSMFQYLNKTVEDVIKSHINTTLFYYF